MQLHLQQSQGVLERVSGPITASFADLRLLPAVQLMPEVKYAGMCAAEWLSAIQALHAQIQERGGVGRGGSTRRAV